MAGSCRLWLIVLFITCLSNKLRAKFVLLGFTVWIFLLLPGQFQNLWTCILHSCGYSFEERVEKQESAKVVSGLELFEAAGQVCTADLLRPLSNLVGYLCCWSDIIWWASFYGVIIQLVPPLLTKLKATGLRKSIFLFQNGTDYTVQPRTWCRHAARGGVIENKCNEGAFYYKGLAKVMDVVCAYLSGKNKKVTLRQTNDRARFLLKRHRKRESKSEKA